MEAATSASTIEGATGNLEAAFVKLGASVLDSVKPAITGGMSWIADGVTNAVPVVQAGIEGLIGWFQRLYSKLEENGAITASNPRGTPSGTRSWASSTWSSTGRT